MRIYHITIAYQPCLGQWRAKCSPSVFAICPTV